MTNTMKSIKALMKQRGYSQRYLALIIGVGEDSMSRWMHGNRTPNIRKVEDMAHALGYEVVLLKKEDRYGASN